MTHDPFPREPLTPEEQALARRLAQPGPQADPSPALDARILAAARADDVRGGRSALRPRPWRIALGVAASLVLAVGLAWRLRPLPGPPIDRGASSAESAASSNVEAGSAQQPAASAAPEKTTGEPAAAFAVPPPREIAAPPALPSVESQRARAPAAPEPAKTIPAAPEPPVVLEAPAPPAPIDDMALPAPPPPAFAPAVQSEPRAEPARKAAAEEMPEEAGVDAAAAADQAAGDEPEMEVPPATADSPDVREAWLQRIRELLAAGQTDAARASLKEFVHRHPDAPLPDDLRALQR